MENITDATSFNLKIRFQGETIPAQCQMIQKHLHPQYRVSLVTESGEVNVFILYKTNQVDKLFFWFPLEGQKQLLAEAIAKFLEKMIKN